MKCQAGDCYAEVAGNNSDYCEMHTGKGTLAFFYHEWDAEQWHDRRDLLRKMWMREDDAKQRKRLIADLIIHSHDVVQFLATQQ